MGVVVWSVMVQVWMGTCGAGGVEGPWCVQTVSTHSRAPLGYWAEGRSQLLKLQGCT